MKDKICISIDRGTLLQVKEKIRLGIYRNKSHAFEFAVQTLVEGDSRDD